MCDATPPAQLRLALDPRAPSRARRLLRSVTCEVHAAAVRDDAELLVSELVTNGILHGAPPVAVRVECHAGSGMWVMVSDGAPSPPRARDAAETAESGRGMGLLDYISDDWGVQPDGDGKTVWFTLRS